MIALSETCILEIHDIENNLGEYKVRMGKTYLKGMVKFAFMLTACLSIICQTQAFAAENAVLSGLEIKPDNRGSYDILLKTDKTVPIKTKANSSNKLEIDLKGVKPSDSLSTTYGNVANIDLVLVKPQNDNIKIFIEGKDVSSSNITFSSAAQNVPALNEIELNNPIDTYTPVVDLSDDEENSSFYESLSSLGITSFIKNALGKSNFGWLLCIAMASIIAYTKLRRNNKDEEEINIPLSLNRNMNKDLKDRDLELYNNLSKASSLIEERAKARRNQAYGLKEYQNSQINPNARFNKATPVKPSFTSTKSALTPGLNATKTRSSQASTMSKLNQNDTRQAELNMNNIKFLEAMTQIYEKSGRVDLANNLQNQLSQKKMSMRKYK